MNVEHHVDPHKTQAVPAPAPENIPVPDEEVLERMDAETPDGRPTTAFWGRQHLLVYVLAIVVGLGALAIIGELAIGWPVGYMVLAVMVLFLGLNPPLWAAIGRARDRDKVLKEISDETLEARTDHRVHPHP